VRITAASALQQSVDSGVLGAACAASLKLFLVCIGIGWLITEGYLPAETAPVLSKVCRLSMRGSRIPIVDCLLLLNDAKR